MFPPLSSNAKIGVLALGSPLSPEREALGIAGLERAGYQVEMPVATSKYYGSYEHGFANGSKSERLEALATLLADDSVEAILSARGGYGLLELFPELDSSIVRASTKPMVGLSDFTTLLAQSRNGFNAPMIHGPSLGDAFADAVVDPSAQRSVDSLISLFSTRPYSYASPLTALRPAEAIQAELLVGNLSVFCSLLGTPWDVSFDNCVVVFEDVGESPYKIHRNLLQLTLAGKFEHVSAVVFGRFAKCSSKFGPTVEQVIELVLQTLWKEYTFPVASGLCVGHWGENHALPIGSTVNVTNSEFSILTD